MFGLIGSYPSFEHWEIIVKRMSMSDGLGREAYNIIIMVHTCFCCGIDRE